MQKYDILLFDADDTLFDFGKAERRAIINTFDKFSIPADEDNIELYVKINKDCWRQLERGEIDKISLRQVRFERLSSALGIDFDAKLAGEFYLADLATHAILIDGARELCERLSKRAKLYIITNGIKTVQTGRMKRSGIEEYIEKCFISEDVGYEKPDIRFFDHVSKSIENFDKSRALVIGDSLTSDIAGGNNFGIDTCWYNPRGSFGEGMTYKVKSYAELEALIFGEV